MMQIQQYLSSDLKALDIGALNVSGVLVVMPFTNAEYAQRAAKLMANRADAPGLILCVQDEQKEGFIAMINCAFTKSQSPYSAYVAQDAYVGRGWLKAGLTKMGDQNHLLGFNDGKWAGALAGFGLARRSWALQNYGGIFFCPEYKSHYADAELTLLAMQAGVYAYEPDSLLVEVDWNKDESSVQPRDRELFLIRKKTGFDGKVRNPKLLGLVS